jgi:hypothetical protein
MGSCTGTYTFILNSRILTVGTRSYNCGRNISKRDIKNHRNIFAPVIGFNWGCYQEKKQYNEQLLLEALPDPELWKHISKSDPAKISALVKSNVLSEKLLRGTYRISHTPYVYVNS